MRTVIIKDAKGEKSILEELRDRKIYIPSDCGGRGACGKCKVFVNGEEVLACKVRVQGDITVSIPEGEDHMEVETEVLGGVSVYDQKGFAIALDIGTTTIAAALVSCSDGKIIEKAACVNHQRAFGSDVISRIESANKGKGQELQRLVREDIDGLIRKISAEEEQLPLVISGNTTMEHLYMGYPCSGLGVAPYTPFDISLKKNENVTLLPGISTFVGADIVSGICVIGMDQSEEVIALIDLGTNGEMAIGNRDKILVTSTAAGPAFEGGNITCGMAGIPGAISHIDFEETGVCVETIGNEPAKGICGSGVIEAVHTLLKLGLIDETGLLEEKYFDEGFPLGEGVLFHQKDVREVQMAKSAIASGFQTLIMEYGIDISQIHRLYLAGGFGQKINVSKTVEIGMLPKELEYRTTAAGNTSLAGAIQYACSSEMEERMIFVSEQAIEVDLAKNKHFNELYMENMYFEEQGS